MKAVKLEKPWDVSCVEMEKPVPKEGEAPIRIVTAGICGSDIGAFRGTNGLVAGLVAQAYGAHAILLDLVQERLDFAKSIGIEHVINSKNEDAVAQIAEITGGEMAHQVMECSGANAAVRSTLDYVSNAGRVTLTGWPKTETFLTKVISIDEAPETIRDIEKNPGDYMKVVVRIADDPNPA